MSFILDALKKSESDRQRQNSPDNAFVPTAPDESSSSRWLLIVSILLAINVLVLLFVFLKPLATNNEPTPVVAENDQESPSDEGASFQDLVANARLEQTPARPPPATEALPQQYQNESAPAAASIDAATQTFDPPTTRGTVYKTLNEVRVDGSVHLPDLHLDIHVYSENPGDRFVFINMDKYTEKGILSEGPTVFEIVPEGVILDHLGTRFLLPRQ